MSVITSIEISHHQLPLDPPFAASWDPQPRTKFPATILRVTDSEGLGWWRTARWVSGSPTSCGPGSRRLGSLLDCAVTALERRA